MRMKKMIMFALALAMLLIAVAAQAEIIPPYGEGQIGLRAAILCEKLTLREAPRSDAGIAGYVNAEYLMIDPAWYRTTGATPVYAWNDVTAPKVGLLDADTTLPILKDEGDWLIVGLRGATGWIRK